MARLRKGPKRLKQNNMSEMPGIGVALPTEAIGRSRFGRLNPAGQPPLWGPWPGEVGR